MSERFDLIVIGGGIVGLATAKHLLARSPDLRLALVEKEDSIAEHQSSHNTGVIHAGIYYRPGSFKARLCHEGKQLLERYAEEKGIPFRRSGKLIVALEDVELPRLAALRERGEANGVDGLEEIGPERMREIEPHVAGIRALWSPGTGVIEYHRVAEAIAADVLRDGAEIRTSTRVTAITRSRDETIVGTSRGDLRTRCLVSCAGLYSDRVAAMTGDAGDMRIVPFRGDYYLFKPEAKRLVRALINPVPDPALPFLGVHFSRRMDDEVLAGPNAVLAFAREGYSIWNVSPRDLFETFTFEGFWNLARKHGSVAARELWRDAVKPAYVRVLQQYLPELRGSDLVAGPSGVRAQSLDRDGNLLDDFSFGESENVLHVRNAPSPAATSSLAIGRHLAERATEKFALAVRDVTSKGPGRHPDGSPGNAASESAPTG